MSVSIVLTAYNRANQLDKTLKSISIQDYRPIEVIVVEDGDDGRTRHIAMQAGARYINHKRPDLPAFQNPSRVHNLGIRAAQNDIVILQGAEVEYTSSTDISQLVAPIEKDELAVRTPVVASLHQDGNFFEWYCHPAEGRRAGWIVNFCLAMRRDLILKIQGFEEGLQGYGYDDDVLMKCLRGSGADVQFVSEVRVNHQWHDRSKYVFYEGFTGKDSPQYAYANKMCEDIDAGIRPAIANYGRPWGNG